MSNVDLKKTYREHYTARRAPELVEVPPRPYLMIDGEGDPNTAPAYRDAIAALYPLAYGIRKAIKDATGVAYTVMPLEGLWWTDDGTSYDQGDRSNWRWIAAICQAPEATVDLAERVLAAVTGKNELVSGHLARLEQFGDGLAAQVLHIGPYSDEGPTIDALHQYIDESGHRPRGKHHEVYLSDARKGDPAKFRTILRQPVTGR